VLVVVVVVVVVVVIVSLYVCNCLHVCCSGVCGFFLWEVEAVTVIGTFAIFAH
jgi:hypothetical protein